MADIPKFSRVHIALEQSPKHAEALGLLLGHWAVLEHMLTGLMQHLLNIEPKKADIVYREIVNFQAKLKLIRRLNYHFTKDEILKDQIDKLLDKADDLNNERNSYIHASWAGDGTNLFRYMNILEGNYKKLHKPSLEIAHTDIMNIVERISELSASCGTLLSQLLATHREQP
jgi:hypothetical protein